jgi:predicted nucleic acid-binding protein
LSLYLDTSVLVATFIREAHSERVDRWLNQQDHADLIISGWVISEFSGALANKQRRGDINELQRTTALSAFSRLCTDSLALVPVRQEAFYRAARIADQQEFGVRAAGALHLAIADDHGATLCTLDRRLSDAGPSLGVATLLI